MNIVRKIVQIIAKTVAVTILLAMLAVTVTSVSLIYVKTLLFRIQ